MNRLVCLLSVVVFISNLLFENYSQTNDEKKRTQKISTNDSYKYIAINDILMWVSNNGDGSHDPRTDGNGFYWPTENGNNLPPVWPNFRKSVIFEDGLIFGGKVNGQIRVNGNTHRQGLTAGKILSPGIADDPSLEKYRVYRIRKDWQSFSPGPEKEALKKDYTEWPVEDGAPWVDINEDGIYTQGIDKPKFEGDEMLWYVANDLDTARTRFTYGSPPMGLEFQTTIYGFFADSSNVLGNVVFKKYKIINKNDTTITDMHFTYWTDDDLGDAGDDFAGCDTALAMGYVYNADNDDGGGDGSTYGISPPAVGHIFLQTPIISGSITDVGYYNNLWQTGIKNIKMNAFVFYIGSASMFRDPQQGVYAGTLELFNYMSGKMWDGSDIIDPTTNLPTRFVLTGDPVSGTGWFEGPVGWPGGPSSSDRRFVMSCGPINMAPGDTQEVVVAILISKGVDNKNSITTLKRDARKLHTLYGLELQPASSINPPVLNSYNGDGTTMLWWNNEEESFEEFDKTLSGNGFSDSTYNFEGYKLWQYSDSLGNNPTLLNIFDLQNDIQLVKDPVLINGIREYVTVINSPNTGVNRIIQISRDSINQTELLNGSPYYFGITTYAYSPHSFRKIVESLPNIVTVIPGRKPIDVTHQYESGDTIYFDQLEGDSDGLAKLVVVDPTNLTGDKYEIVFNDSSGYYSYTFYDKTTGDTLLKDARDFSISTSGKIVLDGMILIVDYPYSYFFPVDRIKSIVEAKGPGGVELNEPQNVFEELNSTGKWMLKSYSAQGDVGTMQTINYMGNISDDDYEIRFTAQGSEYYTTGYSLIGPTTRNNPKGKNRVPFEVWRMIRETGEQERLYIKIMDNQLINQDSSWSYDSVTNRWESIYAYSPLIPYQEPLPLMSGTSQSLQHRFGHLSIVGELPLEGTVIKINTKKPPRSGDKFSAVATAPTKNNFENAKHNINQITIFPNPYFGSSTLEAGGSERIVRMTNLPQKVIARIYSLAGVFIKRIDKDNQSPWLDWDLRNEDGSLIGSGVYLLYLDMPGIGTKTMKLAVVQSN